MPLPGCLGNEWGFLRTVNEKINLFIIMSACCMCVVRAPDWLGVHLICRHWQCCTSCVKCKYITLFTQSQRHIELRSPVQRARAYLGEVVRHRSHTDRLDLNNITGNRAGEAAAMEAANVGDGGGIGRSTIL